MFRSVLLSAKIWCFCTLPTSLISTILFDTERIRATREKTAFKPVFPTLGRRFSGMKRSLKRWNDVVQREVFMHKFNIEKDYWWLDLRRLTTCHNWSSWLRDRDFTFCPLKFPLYSRKCCRFVFFFCKLLTFISCLFVALILVTNNFPKTHNPNTEPRLDLWRRSTCMISRGYKPRPPRCPSPQWKLEPWVDDPVFLVVSVASATSRCQWMSDSSSTKSRSTDLCRADVIGSPLFSTVNSVFTPVNRLQLLGF